MDLSKLQDAQEPLDVPVVFDKNGEPESGFKVVGANSQQYQDADRNWRLANVQRTARAGAPVDARSKEGAQTLLDTVDQRELAIALACTVGIYGFTLKGVPATLDAAVLTDIFAKRPTWRAKVVAKIESEQGFMTA